MQVLNDDIEDVNERKKKTTGHHDFSKKMQMSIVLSLML